jgi:hypothetical protein
MTNCVGKKRKKKTNDYNLLTSMTKTFRVAVLKCCRAGCSTTTWGWSAWQKTSILRNLMNKSTYLKIQIHESTRLCQDSVFCTCTWETTCFKFWSSMYLSCTCKHFLLIYIQDFSAEGDKCLWNTWVGGGEKGRKK